jgi:hypothetical protein
LTRLLGRGLALLLLAGAPAAAAVPDIPGRFDLSGSADLPEKAAARSAASLADLRQVLLSPSQSDARKAEAADAWGLALGKSYGRGDFWPDVERSFGMLDELFAQKLGSPARRRAIFDIFNAVSVQLRGYVIDHPDDPQWRPHWRRAGALRDRGRADKDRRLGEYFERFVPLARAPDWKSVKRRLREIEDHIAASRPDDKDDLDRIWKLSEAIESKQLAWLSDLERNIGKRKLGAEKSRRLTSYVEQVFAYRLYTTWACLHVRAVAEKLNAKEAVAAGLSPQPVKNGWPDY